MINIVTMFNFGNINNQYKIKKPLRLIELFAGIGAQAKALENLKVPFEHYRICEFDKYAVKSYNAVHGTNFETTDITKIHASDLGIVDTDKYDYIMTYSFPCTDLSLAGKCAGMSKGVKTRSGLLWEVERLLNEMTELPQILVMENVTQVHGSKNIADFKSWTSYLESKGYYNTYKDIMATSCGIPQSRDRCFMVSILNGSKGSYEFLSKNKMNPYGNKLEEGKNLEYSVKSDSVVKELITFLDEPYDKRTIVNNSKSKELIDYIISSKEPYYKKSYPIIARNMSKKDAKPYCDKTSISPTLCQRDYKGLSNYGSLAVIVSNADNSTDPGDYILRRPSVFEYWRLMGFDTDDCKKAEQVNSWTQLYRQAGNSIVVQVLESIFKPFFD